MTAVALVLSSAILFLWYARSRYLVVTVRGHSMMPTFRDGQRLLVRRRTGRRTLRPGDVAVFVTPASAADPDGPAWLVKRVTAVAGDEVPPELATGCGRSGPIPVGHCVVRGDNPRSLDSRHFGYLPERSVLGVVCVPRR